MDKRRCRQCYESNSAICRVVSNLNLQTTDHISHTYSFNRFSELTKD